MFQDIENRSEEREECNAVVTFLTQETPGEEHRPVEAQVIDISPTGMGVSTTVALKQKQEILFPKNQENWQLPEKGLVVWSFKQGNNFRAGIEFIL